MSFNDACLVVLGYFSVLFVPLYWLDMMEIFWLSTLAFIVSFVCLHVGFMIYDYYDLKSETMKFHKLLRLTKISHERK